MFKKQILLLFFLLLVPACQSTNGFVTVNDGNIPKQEHSQEPGTNKVLFVEHIIQTIGKLTPATKEVYSRFQFIDGPAYFWNNTKKTLSIQRDWTSYKFDERDKIIYGCGLILGGDIGSGIGTNLYSSYNIPFSPETGVEISKVDKNGTVSIRYEEKDIVLLPNQKVQSIHKRQEKDGTTIISITVTEWFFNSGFINPDQVIGPRKISPTATEK